MRTLSILALLLVLAIAATPGHAEEPDAETRFHDAYVQEVIEGDVAGAARVYLALMDEEQAPLRVQAESRFRFAVCAVLLGRPDEARARLAALAGDEAMPKAVRDRAAAYRSEISELGVGTELEKKLESLVFELARESSSHFHKVPAVYREFEVIGRAALPFIRRLRGHSDASIRGHALHLLLRMDEPGLGGTWLAAEGPLRGVAAQAFCRYLKARPSELAAFERIVLEGGEPAFRKVRGMSPWPRFSLSFLRALAEAKREPAAIIGWLQLWGDDKDARLAQLLVWAQSEDERMAARATDHAIRHADSWADTATPRLLAAMMERLAARPAPKNGSTLDGTLGEGLQRLLARQPVAVTTDRIDALLDALPEQDDPWRGGVPELLEILLDGLAQRLHEEPALAAPLAKALRRQLEVLGDRDEPGGPAWYRPHFAARVATVLRTAPEPDAAAFANWFVKTPLFQRTAGHPERPWHGVLNPIASARGVRLAIRALQALPPATSSKAAARLRVLPSNERPVEVDHALLAHLPTVGTARLHGLFSSLVVHWREALVHVAPDKSRPAVWELFQTIRQIEDPAQRKRARQILASHGRNERIAENDVDVVLPLAIARADEWDEEEILFLARRAFKHFEHARQLWAEPDRTPPGLRGFLLANAGAILMDRPRSFLEAEGRFPLETWLPRAPDGWWQRHRETGIVVGSYRPSAIAEMCRALAKTPERINNAVLQVAALYGRDPAATALVFDPLLASDDAARRGRALELLKWPNGTGASDDGLEACLAHEIVARPMDLSRLRRLAGALLGRSPSERLVPVARALLGAPGRAEIVQGASLAESLGRPDLVPALRAHLDSLDPKVRGAAQKAIAGINRLELLRAGKVAPRGD